MWSSTRPIAMILFAWALAACSGRSPDDGPAYAPTIEPAAFVATIDNPYFPLKPGTRWVYEGAGERIVVEVTNETKTIKGVTCTVVRDTVSVNGEVKEDTFDWYAQDRAGNVWYFGEDSREMRGGSVVGREGSWEAGVDGAQPGIIMKADPRAGDRYRQEFYRGKAEDVGEVVRVGKAVTVPFGSFTDVLVILDTTPLEPGAREHKHYARGIGLVLESNVAGGARVELVELTRHGS